MPPRRTKAGASSSSSRAGQSTLSFNKRAGRVTKPTISQPSSDKKPASKLNQVAQAEVLKQLSEPEPAVTTIEIKDDHQPLKQIEPKAQDDSDVTPTKPKSKKKSRTSTSSLTVDDLESAISSAQSIPETRIKKYWSAEESSRLAPRGTWPSPFHQTPSHTIHKAHNSQVLQTNVSFYY